MLNYDFSRNSTDSDTQHRRMDIFNIVVYAAASARCAQISRLSIDE